MSHKINDGFQSRSTRCRQRRIAKGLCPDCGEVVERIEERVIKTRCFKCRIKRNGMRRLQRINL